MIHKILVENFFSISEEQEIVLNIPDNAPDLSCFKPSLSLPFKRLPAVVGFFGPNASGKTTILRSLVTLVEFISNSVKLEFDAPIYYFQPYMAKEFLNKPTKITVEFDGMSPGTGNSFSLFRYELNIAHCVTKGQGLGSKVLLESLSYSPNGKFRRIFERHGQTFKFGPEFLIKDKDPRIEIIRPNASLLSTLAHFNHELSMNLVSSLKIVQSNIWEFNKAEANFEKLFKYYDDTPKCFEDLNREVRRFDVGIEKVILRKSSQGSYLAEFNHTGLDLPIYFIEESSGTRRFISLFPYLHYVLETGGIAIIDEIDSDLHPLLIPELFNWFYDPERNKKKAQLFFTAHNPSLLDELEKEQVFFTQKLSGKPTEVYRASHIKGLRRDPGLMKKYLGGELGAVPYIG